MGDGTNFVVTFAGELLAKAEELIMLVVLSPLSHLQGVHERHHHGLREGV